MGFDLGSKILQDGGRSLKGFYLKMVMVVAVVAVNLVAFYTFSQFSSRGGDDRTSSPAQLEMEMKQFSLMANGLIVKLSQTREELRNTQHELQIAREELKLLLDGIGELTKSRLSAGDGDPREMLMKTMPDSAELREMIVPRKLPLGWNPSLSSDTMTAPVGHACFAQREDVRKFMDYEVGGSCPDDEAMAQKLLLAGCEPLPRRRCFARTPQNYTEPLPVPRSYWEQPPDGNILWTPYPCKSFDCLNTRAQRKIFADCLDCFDLQGREKHRWTAMSTKLDYTIQEVMALKPEGSIRIGLDIGGGTGSFAVRMIQHNVTIVTTSLNLGGPFNTFIAQRGVIPLFLTIASRFPFFDNTLDIVHSMHALSNWIPSETLEFILLDVDRVLRPGGILWLDHFFCLRPQLSGYVAMLERLGYKKLRWGVGEKLDRGRELQEMYISAVLEKPMKR